MVGLNEFFNGVAQNQIGVLGTAQSKSKSILARIAYILLFHIPLIATGIITLKNEVEGNQALQLNSISASQAVINGMLEPFISMTNEVSEIYYSPVASATWKTVALITNRPGVLCSVRANADINSINDCGHYLTVKITIDGVSCEYDGSYLCNEIAGVMLNIIVDLPFLAECKVEIKSSQTGYGLRSSAFYTRSY